MQSSIFDTCADETQFDTHELDQAIIDYYPNWLQASKAKTVFDRVTDELSWQQSAIRLYGKSVTIPRLNAWYGDAHCYYAYSNTRFTPQAWVPCLTELRDKLEQTLVKPFNCVLANWYRDGRDSMAWHSDDEPELGAQPVIASISLGDPRRFILRRKDDHSKKIEFSLGHGSLLVMRGHTQQYWQHQIPKTQKVVGSRVNLTYRQIANTHD